MCNKKIIFPILSLMLALTGVIALLWLFSLPQKARANPANRYVAVGGADASNDCTSSSAPCRTVQHAVDVAEPGDSILVATGVYTDVHSHLKPPGYMAPPSFSNVFQVVYIDKTITIRGGFSDAFSEPPDPQANPTTLNAEGGGRVIFVYGTISPTISVTVEGLSITGGNATGLYGEGGPADAGGGVYASDANVTLRNNRVYENTAYYGGGMYLRYIHATLDHNTIMTNTGNIGGGVRLYYSDDATIISNTIRSNTASYGGGLVLSNSSGLVRANAIISNTATSNGGGVYLLVAGNSTICENSIISNTSVGDGGGLYVYSSDATIVKNTVVANHAESGGGLWLYESNATSISNTIEANTADVGGGLLLWYSNAVLNDNIIIANTANYGNGCGLWLRRSNPRMVNNVVADNLTGTTTGSGIYIADGSQPQLLHTTIARNGGNQGYGVYVTTYATLNSTAVLTNTILIGHKWGVQVAPGNTAELEATLWGNTFDWNGPGTIITGTNNYWGDPHFIGDGYHLTFGSAAIDRGVAAGVFTDVDGDPRPSGSGFRHRRG